MKPQSENLSSTQPRESANQSQNPDPHSPTGQLPRPPRRGRPRVLDDLKRSEIYGLVASGCTTREAARYVRCSPRTIRREAARDPEFHANLRRSEMYAQLSPLRAIQHAVGTHWRAAAWFLERAYPERFARRNQSALGLKQVRRLHDEVRHIIHSEVVDPFQLSRIEKRLRMTFDYLMDVAGRSERNGRDFRQAVRFLEQKERLDDPLAKFGCATPDFDALFKTKGPPARPAAAKSSAPSPTRDAPEPTKPPADAGTSPFRPPSSPAGPIRC